jgi:PKD repeat protein
MSVKLKLVSALAAIALSLTFTAAAAETVAAATPFSFAVIGDTPYGSTQLSVFPQRIGQINADPQVQLVTHLGDIGGPPNCSDSYYATIRANFDTFADPLVYTPGDNEWADCSGASVGAANPLDRLAALRQVFFPAPGTTLGRNAASVTAQSGYPENVLYDREGLTFAAVHIVGSANDLATWSGYSAPTSAQTAEVNARTDAGIALIHAAFQRATANASRAVVFTTQADMFKGTPSRTAYEPLVKAFASESLAYQLPVFLFNGDTHSFASDRPLTSSTWLSYYGLTTPVPNFSRITVEGGATMDEWLKVTVVDTSAVLAVQRVPFTVNAAPVASFTASASGLTAAFDASASTDDAGITGYGWAFGDGSTGTGVSASHSYAAAGTYNVTLTVTDTQGATGTKTTPVTVSTSSGSVTDVVVPAKSVWKYRYSTTAPDPAWKNPGYNSSAWNTGPGALGYGSTPLGTNLNPSATTSARPLAAYFLRSFSIPTASAVTALKLTTVADDGVVIYVNGTEVGRTRMPTGTVTINTYATAAIPTSNANAAPVTFNVPLSLLVNGTNTIAAETHLNYHATKDISFDLTATTTTSG